MHNMQGSCGGMPQRGAPHLQDRKNPHKKAEQGQLSYSFKRFRSPHLSHARHHLTRIHLLISHHRPDRVGPRHVLVPKVPLHTRQLRGRQITQSTTLPGLFCGSILCWSWIGSWHAHGQHSHTEHAGTLPQRAFARMDIMPAHDHERGSSKRKAPTSSAREASTRRMRACGLVDVTHAANSASDVSLMSSV